MKVWAKRNHQGFTIIELLIVIVIIAVLAVISVVAYNGIQQRARNSQIEDAVRIYQKALVNYAIDNHSYPTDYTCLGANYPNNQCFNGPNGNFYTRATVDAALAPYLNNGQVVVSTHPLQITTAPDYRMGALLRNSAPNFYIAYYLEGAGQACLDGYAGVTEMQGTQCHLNLQDPTTY